MLKSDLVNALQALNSNDYKSDVLIRLDGKLYPIEKLGILYYLESNSMASQQTIQSYILDVR